MKFCALSLTALSLGGLMSLSAHANIFTPNSQVGVSAATAPYRYVGRYFHTGEKNACTATLISEDIVLTASHCLLSESGGYVDPQGIRFQMEAGGPLQTDQSVELADDGPSLWVGEAGEVGNDWALLRIKKPLGRKVGWAGVKAVSLNFFNKQHGVMAVGYLNGVRLTADPHCALRGKYSKSLIPGRRFYSFQDDCDSKPAFSGGPLLTTGADGLWYVTSVISGPMSEFDEDVSYSDETANMSSPSQAFLPLFQKILAAQKNGLQLPPATVEFVSDFYSWGRSKY